MLSKVWESGLRFLWLAILAVILDQLSKNWVVANFELYQSVQVNGFFNLTYVRNTGAAFSFLHDAGGWQRWFFTVLGLGVSGLILWWLKQTKREQVMLPCAFSLILGGALGNVLDRIQYGYVVDFFDLYYQQWHWPAFNIADSAICLGAILLIVDMFKNKDLKDD
jgi:signal peptidase II